MSWSYIGQVLPVRILDDEVIIYSTSLEEIARHRRVPSTQSGVRHNGDLTPGISPDGQWVAFARRDFSDAALPFNLWKIPIGGGTAKRLTRTTGVGITDFYPRWSPDGAWILFDRRFPADTITHHSVTHGIFKVPADSGAVVQVYGPVEPPAGGDTLIAVTPAWSATVA